MTDGNDEEENNEWRERIYDQMAKVRWEIAADHEPYRARGKSSNDYRSRDKNKKGMNTTHSPGGGKANNDNTKTSNNAQPSSDKKGDNSNSNFEANLGLKGNEFKSY